MADVMLASNSNQIVKKLARDLGERRFTYTTVSSGQALRDFIHTTAVSETKVAVLDPDLPGWSDDLITSIKTETPPGTGFVVLWDDTKDLRRISGYHWENFILLSKPRDTWKDEKASEAIQTISDHVLALASPLYGRKFKSVVYDPNKRELLVEYLNGRAYRFPIRFVRGLDKTPIEEVQLIDNGVALRIVQASGNETEVPWDYVLYHVEPEYEHYKGLPEERIREKDSRQRVARRLRAIRESKNLTTRQLAKLSGIHHPNITRIETGRSRPNLETLARLSKALGVKTSDILQGL